MSMQNLEARAKSFAEGIVSFRNCFSPSLPIVVTCSDDEDKTRQSFKDECDINILLARYNRTGELPVVDGKYPQYLDVTGMDYQTHMNFIAGANTMFAELSSDLRARFKNDPANFLDFVSQDKNRKEMAELGLLSPEATKKILMPETVSEPAKPAEPPAV